MRSRSKVNAFVEQAQKKFHRSASLMFAGASRVVTMWPMWRCLRSRKTALHAVRTFLIGIAKTWTDKKIARESLFAHGEDANAARRWRGALSHARGRIKDAVLECRFDFIRYLAKDGHHHNTACKREMIFVKFFHGVSLARSRAAPSVARFKNISRFAQALLDESERI